MKFGFQQKDVCHIKGDLSSAVAAKLPEKIAYYTGWNYKIEQITDGYLLTPTFKKAPYRNSFVPEITVCISPSDGETVVQFVGQPVLFTRVFMGVWFCTLAFFAVVFLSLFLLGAMETPWFLLAPAGMGVFGYLLCKLGTKYTFRSIMKAIRGALEH